MQGEATDSEGPVGGLARSVGRARGRPHRVLGKMLSIRLALALTLAAAIGACAAPGASAVIVHLEAGRTISYAPLRQESLRAFDEFFSNVEYNGGPVMPANTNYPVYWAPPGAPEYPPEYEQGIDRYFEDLAHDSGGVGNVDSVSAQYDDAAGERANYESHFGGALVDSDPYPANGCHRAPICLTDAQLRSELTAFVTRLGLPTDLTHEYFLLTPPGVEDCLRPSGEECSAGAINSTYCAYHGDIPMPGGALVFANDPYVTGNRGCDDGNHPNNSTSDGAIEGGLSHEHNESITDPEPDAAWSAIEGGGEVADKCRTFEPASEYGTPLGTAEDGAKYNQVINGDRYWSQQIWSNQSQQCLQRLSFSGERPVASFTAKAGSANEERFDASASSAPGGVARYDWQFDDGPGPTRTVETTTPTIIHPYAEAGVYDVALTVYAADGTSDGTAHEVLVGKAPAPTVTRLTPNKGAAAGATTVTITGTSLTGASTVAFGTQDASFYEKSATTIVALSPAGALGAVDVRVSTPAGTSAITTHDEFKYEPAVTGLSPNSGSVAGDTVVRVTGMAFATGKKGTMFRFGAAKATNVNCTSSTSCTVTAPPHAAGTVTVKATVAKLSSPSEPPGDQFTYE